MGNKGNISFYKLPCRIDIDLRGITAVDIYSRFVACRLQSQFHPSGLYTGIRFQHIQNIIGQAIGPCGNRNSHNILSSVGAVQFFPRNLRWKIGGGKALEICNIFFRTLVFYLLGGKVYLLVYGQGRVWNKIPASRL